MIFYDILPYVRLSIHVYDLLIKKIRNATVRVMKREEKIIK
jgi:hypothetical protein